MRRVFCGGSLLIASFAFAGSAPSSPEAISGMDVFPSSVGRKSQWPLTFSIQVKKSNAPLVSIVLNEIDTNYQTIGKIAEFRQSEKTSAHQNYTATIVLPSDRSRMFEAVANVKGVKNPVKLSNTVLLVLDAVNENLPKAKVRNESIDFIDKTGKVVSVRSLQARKLDRKLGIETDERGEVSPDLTRVLIIRNKVRIAEESEQISTAAELVQSGKTLWTRTSKTGSSYYWEEGEPRLSSSGDRAVLLECEDSFPCSDPKIEVINLEGKAVYSALLAKIHVSHPKISLNGKRVAFLGLEEAPNAESPQNVFEVIDIESKQTWKHSFSSTEAEYLIENERGGFILTNGNEVIATLPPK